MRRTVIAHILLIAFGVQVLLGGTGGVVVCLGGHEHGPVETGHCESFCSHDSAWPIPLPENDRDHDENCGCTDVEFEVSELPILPRVDHGAPDDLTAAPAPDWGVFVAGAGLCRRGPPSPPPPWFDPAREQRIELVLSVVLTI